MVLSLFQKLTGVPLRKIQAVRENITIDPVNGGTVGGKEIFIRGQRLLSIPPLSVYPCPFEVSAHSMLASFARTTSVPSLLAPSSGIATEVYPPDQELQSSDGLALLFAIDGQELIGLHILT